MKGAKIHWTDEMILKLKAEFAIRFSRDIGADMGISIRSVIRKARELGLEKEAGFLDKNRKEISARAQEARPENPTKGDSSFRIPGGEAFQFKKGQARHPVDYEKIHEKRNATIQKEKLRIKYGLQQKTKLKLVNIY